MGASGYPWYVDKARFAAWFACFFVVVTGIISTLHIRYHLKHYHQPVVQRYTIRIVLMVPVYAIDSCISLFTYRSIASFIITTLRDIYEAYTLYNFLALLLCYLGGPNVLVSKWKDERHTKAAASSPEAKGGEEGNDEEDELSKVFGWWTLTCCLKNLLTIDLNNPLFLRLIKMGVLQYIFVKIILAVVSLVLECLHDYDEGHIKFNRGYVYVVFIYNVSIFIALYSLVVFYLSTKKYLKPYKPIIKFALVKTIIFVTFWQNLVISALFHFGVIQPLEKLDSIESAAFVQNFLICVESVLLALLNVVGFPPGTVIKGKESNVVHSLKHFVQMNDVLLDTAATFDPNYKEFVPIEMSEGFHVVDSPVPPAPPEPKTQSPPPLVDVDGASGSNSTLIAANSVRSHDL